MTHDPGVQTGNEVTESVTSGTAPTPTHDPLQPLTPEEGGLHGDISDTPETRAWFQELGEKAQTATQETSADDWHTYTRQYRVMQTTSGMWEVREVYFDETGAVQAWTARAGSMWGVSEADLRAAVQDKVDALSRPVLVESDLPNNSDEDHAASEVEVAPHEPSCPHNVPQVVAETVNECVRAVEAVRNYVYGPAGVTDEESELFDRIIAALKAVGVKMSADNYYIVRVHPEGGFTYVQGFASDSDDGEIDFTIEVDPSSPMFAFLNEAVRAAREAVSEYGVYEHPEIAEFVPCINCGLSPCVCTPAPCCGQPWGPIDVTRDYCGWCGAERNTTT